MPRPKAWPKCGRSRAKNCFKRKSRSRPPGAAIEKETQTMAVAATDQRRGQHERCQPECGSEVRDVIHRCAQRSARAIGKPFRDPKIRRDKPIPRPDLLQQSAKDRGRREEEENSHREVNAEIAIRGESLLQPVDLPGKAAPEIFHRRARAKLPPPFANLQLAARDTPPKQKRDDDHRDENGGDHAGSSHPALDQMPALPEEVAEERKNHRPKNATDRVIGEEAQIGQTRRSCEKWH